MSEAFSCIVSTVGLVLPFILADPPVADAVPISNAISVTSVIWRTQDGQARLLTVSQVGSAVYTYTLSMGDTRSPRSEQGYLEVTMGTMVFPTSHFTFLVRSHF